MDEGHISLFSGLSDAFLGTFPTSGMTVNGVAYELPTWEPATDASGSSSSPDETMFGTPPARMWKGSGPEGSKSHTWLLNHGNVEAQVLMLPTPTVSDTNGPGMHGDGGLDLRTAVNLLPTPGATDGNGTGQAQSVEALRTGGHQLHATDIPRLLEMSTGETTPTPSAAGKESSDGQLHGQQNLLDAITDTA